MPSVVQHRTNFSTNTSTLTLAFASNNAAGNRLAYMSASFATMKAATDNNSNTIANAVNVTNGSGTGGNGRIDYVKNSNSGACTVTIGTSGGGSDDLHAHIWEVSGCDTTAAVQDSGSVGGTGSTTGSVSTAGTATNSGDAVLAFFYDNSNNKTLTAGTGYSPSDSSNNTTGGDCALSEYKSATASGTQTATCGGNGTDPLGPQIIVTFAQAPSGPTVGEMMAARQCGQIDPIFEERGIEDY